MHSTNNIEALTWLAAFLGRLWFKGNSSSHLIKRDPVKIFHGAIGISTRLHPIRCQACQYHTLRTYKHITTNTHPNPFLKCDNTRWKGTSPSCNPLNCTSTPLQTGDMDGENFELHENDQHKQYTNNHLRILDFIDHIIYRLLLSLFVLSGQRMVGSWGRWTSGE